MTFIAMIDRYYNKKPNLVVLFKAGKLFDYPLNVPEYRESYFDLFKVASKEFSVFVVRGVKVHWRQGIFKSGYYFTHSHFQVWPKKIAAKVVYDKNVDELFAAKTNRDWSMINQFGLKKICYNKHLTYLTFPQFHKFTCQFFDKKGALRCLKKIKTDQVVYKPIYGLGGRGIIIGRPKIVLRKLKNFNQGLFQEFIDTSAGITGICPSYHDLRAIIMDGRIVQSYVRIPKSGSLVANVAQGGTLKEISKESLPTSVLKIIKQVDLIFKKFGHRVYAVDFGLEKDQPYLMEINRAPGMPFKKEKYYHQYHRDLLKVFKAALKN